MTALILIVLCGAAGYGALVWSKRQARLRLLAGRLTPDQREIMAQAVPLTRRLPTDLRDKLESKMSLFLHQVEFIGCDDLEVSEEMELSIAAQACLLVMNSDSWYETLRTVLIYPGAFKSVQRETDGYVVTEREVVRLGESWARGPVVLSWADSERGAFNDLDGHNVVLHEFAHQFDALSSQTNGAPVLASGQSYAEWGRIFQEGFTRHMEEVSRGRRTVIDAYGATAPEEFFATAVEVFFEKPQQLRREEPEIYDELAALFGLNPADWSEPRS